MSSIKALSLHQPWPSLIAVGAKRIETRSWRPPDSAMGMPLAIHAAKRVVKFPDTPLYCRFNEAVEQYLGPNWQSTIPTGAVLAIATLSEARLFRHREDLPDGDEALFGEYGPGRWMWKLTNVVPVEPPQPARGYQGLWTWDGGDLASDYRPHLISE